MKNIEEQQIIIECPNTIFHLYIDSEDELSKVKVFMNNMKNVDSISLHDIYNWCNRQHVQYTTTFNYDSKMTLTEMIKSYTTGATDSMCSTRRHLIMTVK